jgi:hypothetical protein
MKLIFTMLLAFLVVTAVMTSGCVTQDGDGGGQPAEADPEEQAFKAIEDEVGALDDMTLEDIENELIDQG